MCEANEEPELRFLDKRPENLVAHPPLASSLQNFESCLFLIALGRYPHAFTACTFAIESALKAAFGIPSEDWRRVPLDRRRAIQAKFGIPSERRPDLNILLSQARAQLPSLRAFPQPNIDHLRETRNRMVHYGFTPKDDRLTATLLLESGFPFLTAVYKGFFQFDLYEALHAEFGEQLGFAYKFRPEVRE